jgi:membrane-bound ClpP family serine protease
MTVKFSTYKAYSLRHLLLFCLLIINYHAISQADTLQKDSITIIKKPTTQKTEQIIYHFKLYDDIMPAAGRLVKNAIKEAEAAKADVIIMELNTYGGRVDIADTIKTFLLNTDIKTVSYIVNNALSAGAFISIACDSIYMKEDATIGAVTVVSGTDGSQMPDKYQSVMRAQNEIGC